MSSPGDSNPTAARPSLHEIGRAVWNNSASVTLVAGTGQIFDLSPHLRVRACHFKPWWRMSNISFSP